METWFLNDVSFTEEVLLRWWDQTSTGQTVACFDLKGIFLVKDFMEKNL